MARMKQLNNRLELAAYFNELGFKKGAEIGVCTGRYSRILLDAIPGVQLLGVDPYRPYQGYTDYRRVSSHNRNLEEARAVTGEFPNYSLVLAFGNEASEWIADESLDFVFIDGNHQYPDVKDDIEHWAPKVRKGGIVSGHDYYNFASGKGGVVQAVDEYASAHGYEVFNTGWTKGAHHDDKQPDWYLQR